MQLLKPHAPLLNLGVKTIPKKQDQDPGRQGHESTDLNSASASREKIERFPVLVGIRRYAPEQVVLVGRPRSGKSTALARLLLQEAQLAQRDSQAQIPVLVLLRRYDPKYHPTAQKQAKLKVRPSRNRSNPCPPPSN